VSYHKCHTVTVSCHMIKSHEEYGKIVHRPCSSCISSVQEINKDSIEFSLSTWTWSGFESSWLEPYSHMRYYAYLPVEVSIKLQ